MRIRHSEPNHHNVQSRICVNALALRTGGGLSYAAELIPEIRRLHGDATRVLITRSQLRSLAWSHWDGLVVYPNWLALPAIRLAFEAFVLPVALMVWGCTSVLMCGNLGLFWCPARQVVVQHAAFGAAAAERSRVRKIKWQLRQTLARMTAGLADAVVYVSESLKNDLAALGFPPGRVIRHGVNPLYRADNHEIAERTVEQKYDVSGPFILCVADIYPHKNLALAIRVLHTIRQRAHPAMKLVLAGAAADAVEVDRLKDFTGQLGVADSVRFIGRVEREDLRYLYNAAAVFLAPSSAESFGMPLLEALRCGCPVVCSDIPAFKEVAAEVGVYFAPDNAAHATEQVEAALTIERPYHAGIEHTRPFSWEYAAMETLSVLAPIGTTIDETRMSGYLPATDPRHTP
jgi:glycosyltransferase involved in cell wall biosynthesis